MQYLKLFSLKDLKMEREKIRKTRKSKRWTVTQGTKETRWNLARFGGKWWALTLVVNLGALVSQLDRENRLSAPND